MRKYLFILMAAAGILAAGCSKKAEQPAAEEEVVQNEKEPVKEEPAAEPVQAEEPAAKPGGAEGTQDDPNSVESLLNGLKENEYEGLQISAEILPRMAILPGMNVPVTVVIKNTGEKTIAYVQGSGAFETPDALFVDAGGLQWIEPKDHLGPVTKDFRMKELKPGEEIKHTLYVQTTQENKDFNQYTSDLYNQKQEYIGDLEWTALQEAYPDLTAAAPGSYTGAVYFRYHIVGESAENLLGDNTGYAKAEFTTTVNE